MYPNQYSKIYKLKLKLSNTFKFQANIFYRSKNKTALKIRNLALTKGKDHQNQISRATGKKNIKNPSYPPRVLTQEGGHGVFRQVTDPRLLKHI